MKIRDLLPIEKIDIFLDFNKSPIFVGSLIYHQKKIYFEYSKDFIKTKLEISPLERLSFTNNLLGVPTYKPQLKNNIQIENLDLNTYSLEAKKFQLPHG